MGGELFDRVPQFLSVEAEIDRLLGYSVRDVCLRGSDAQLRDTRYTQPCLFVVNALSYYEALRTSPAPAAVAGHSLGEYNALCAAGVFDLLTGIRLVAERGALMATANGGGMAAVLKLRAQEVVDVLAAGGLPGVDIANYNAPQQTVIAGPADVIARAKSQFEARGATYVPLPVSAAFHSRHMAGAAERFRVFLTSFTFDVPRVPVVSNVTGQFYPARTHGDMIQTLLVRQITAPVRWVDGIRHLRRWGITSFRETGPGGVLTRLCQQIDPPVAV